jgi:hypothetical protein
MDSQYDCEWKRKEGRMISFRLTHAFTLSQTSLKGEW